MNGAGLRWTDPQKGMVVSNVSGAVLRRNTVYFKICLFVPFSSTTAYDFSDSTELNFVIHFRIFSCRDCSFSGAGQISGFKAITFVKTLKSFKWIKSYW
jgi:hypothetical protein